MNRFKKSLDFISGPILSVQSTKLSTIITRDRPAGACGAEGLSRISILDFVTSRSPCLSATLGPRGGVTDSDDALVELKFHSSYVSHDGV